MLCEFSKPLFCHVLCDHVAIVRLITKVSCAYTVKHSLRGWSSGQGGGGFDAVQYDSVKEGSRSGSTSSVYHHAMWNIGHRSGASSCL